MTDAQQSDDLERAVAVLAAGGVALVPTDTVYGLAVRPDDLEAVCQVFTLKRRPVSRNLPVMVASVDDVADLGVEITEPARRLLASALMPGPVTLALGLRLGEPGVVPGWLADRDEVAVRVPDDAWLAQLLRRTGPLLMTSANAHAQATQESVAGILDQLNGIPDVIVDAGPLDVVPSTLVNCHAHPPRIEREGAVPAGRILEIIG